MTSRRELYERVNHAWPADLLPPTSEEAVNAARRLWRWGMGSTWTGEVRVTSGNRYTWVYGGVLHVNPDRKTREGGGWHSLVHDLGHVMYYINGGRAHSKDHARIERAMVRECIKREWLKTKPLHARVAEAMPGTAIEIAVHLGLTYRQVRGAALHLVRDGKARWRGQVLTR